MVYINKRFTKHIIKEIFSFYFCTESKLQICQNMYYLRIIKKPGFFSRRSTFAAILLRSRGVHGGREG